VTKRRKNCMCKRQQLRRRERQMFPQVGTNHKMRWLNLSTKRKMIAQWSTREDLSDEACNTVKGMYGVQLIPIKKRITEVGCGKIASFMKWRCHVDERWRRKVVVESKKSSTYGYGSEYGSEDITSTMQHFSNSVNNKPLHQCYRH
jgi:hypothetical protein